MQFKEWLITESRMTTVFHASPNADIYKLVPKRGTQSVPMGQAGIYVAPTFKDAVAWAVSFVGHKKRPDTYKNITIYTLKLPKSVIDDAWSEDWWEKEFFIPEDKISGMEIVGRQQFPFKELSRMNYRWDQINWEQKRSRYDMNKIAETLRNTNPAADYYLKLKKIFQDQLMKVKGERPDFSGIENALKILPKYFCKIDTWGQPEPFARLDPKKTAEVHQLVAPWFSRVNPIVPQGTWTTED